MIRVLASLLTSLLLVSTTAFAAGPAAPAPAIASAGAFHALPHAAYQPVRGATYKAIFGLTKGAEQPSQINPGLERVARTVNLYTHAGVPLSHLKFVAIASGTATPIALNDEQYRKKFGVANPNLPVIAELRKVGVDIAVCGQALAEHDFQNDWVDPRVTLALSALTTMIELQQQGYALIPM
ncbi:MAG: DsrE family protein [Dokdonella sp.]